MKYHYSILNTFIGLIFVFFISLIFCLGSKVNKLKINLEQNELKIVSENINHGITELLQLYKTKLELLNKIVLDGKYYVDQSKMNHLVDLLIDHKNNGNQFAHNIIWEPDNQNINNKSNQITPIIEIIKDENGKPKGKIITEIKINYLKKYIEHILNGKEIYYALISKNDYKVIDGKIKNKDIDNITMVNVFHRFQNRLNLVSDYKESNFYYAVNDINDLNITIILAQPKQNSYLNQFKFLSNYRLEIIYSTLLLFILFYIFYRAIINPFIMLSEAALEISNGNIPLIPSKTTNSKEGFLVYSALNKIKSSLNLERELVQELTKAHNKLSITNLRLENKVASRTQKLEQALQVKDRFISYLTYELKTPLKGLTNLVQSTFLKWPSLSDDKKADFSQHVLYTLNRLMSLINGMLSISNVNSDNETLKLSNFCLTELVEEIVTECKVLHLNQKNININFLCTEKILILADRDKIGQVVRNIIVSSIEWSENNNYIAIKLVNSEIIDENLKTGEKAVQFILCDNSKEMSAELLTNLFSQRNIKIDNISLNISQELISLHHGRIWASNNSDGGTTMNFIIPIYQIDSAPGKSQPNYIDINPNKYNVLMIDDEELCTTGMKIQLRNSKYNLIKCNDAQTGLDYLSKNYNNIAIILLDLMMPDIYGLNVLSEIKANNNYKNISIILQTGSTDEDEIVKAFNMGINCFIKKPYNKKMILRELEKALRLHDLNKENTV